MIIPTLPAITLQVEANNLRNQYLRAWYPQAVKHVSALLGKTVLKTDGSVTKQAYAATRMEGMPTSHCAENAKVSCGNARVHLSLEWGTYQVTLRISVDMCNSERSYERITANSSYTVATIDDRVLTKIFEPSSTFSFYNEDDDVDTVVAGLMRVQQLDAELDRAKQAVSQYI